MTSIQDILKGLTPDPDASRLYGRPIYNVMEVDDRLHELFGDYDQGDNPKSMQEIVMGKCGEQTMRQLKYYLGL